MLKVDPRITNKYIRRRLGNQPCHRRVGHGPPDQARFVTPEFGPEGPIKAENRPGGQTALPECVAVFEAIQKKSLPSTTVPMDVKRTPIEPDAGWGKVWTGR